MVDGLSVEALVAQTVTNFYTSMFEVAPADAGRTPFVL
jgi:hypothetical protein